MSTTAHPTPDFSKAKQSHQEELRGYMNSFTASSQIGMTPHMFNRITGVVFVYAGPKRYPVSDADKKINIGLQLKQLKQVFLAIMANQRPKFIESFSLIYSI